MKDFIARQAIPLSGVFAAMLWWACDCTMREIVVSFFVGAAALIGTSIEDQRRLNEVRRMNEQYIAFLERRDSNAV